MRIPLLTPTRANGNETIRERLSSLEGKMAVLLALDVGTFLIVLGLLFSRAF